MRLRVVLGWQRRKWLPARTKTVTKRKSGSKLPHSRRSYLQNQLYHGWEKSQEKVFKNTRRVEPRDYVSAAPLLRGGDRNHGVFIGSAGPHHVGFIGIRVLGLGVAQRLARRTENHDMGARDD